MTLAAALPPTMRVFERGWLSSNNILFAGPETVLVDSGYVTHAAQTAALVHHVLGSRRLERLINTHLHSDHCGGNAALRRIHGCRIAIPAGDAEAVLAWDEDGLSFTATAQQCARFSFDDTWAAGDLLHLGGMDWRALAAPGHDAHALLLYCEREGILISADALWENGFGVIFPELEGKPGFAEQRAVLETIGTLDLRLVIPGHGAPFADVHGALARAHRRLDDFCADPLRHARHALKVLIAFLLLDRRRLEPAVIADTIAASRLMHAAAVQLGAEPEALAAEVASALVAAGAARFDGTALVCAPG